jgi:hypothetical protein
MQFYGEEFEFDGTNATTTATQSLPSDLDSDGDEEGDGDLDYDFDADDDDASSDSDDSDDDDATLDDADVEDDGADQDADAAVAEFLKDNPDFLVVPSPDKKMLRMSHAAISPHLLNEVAIPCSKVLFDKLLDDGFIRLHNSKFATEIQHKPKELSQQRAGAYLVVNKITKKIKKAGSTKNAKQRDVFRREKAALSLDEYMVEIFNLDLLTAKADHYAQEAYYEMMKRLCEHTACPKPLKHVLKTYLSRGGNDLGFKKNTILQMVELGAQCHFGVRRDFEFLMFDEKKYQGRKVRINAVFSQIQQKLVEIFGAEARGRVTVKLGSSWKPGTSDTLKNGAPRLFTKQVAMESIVGRSIDMSQTNMVNVPAYPGTTDPTKMYSVKGYSDLQLDKGLEQFDGMVDTLQEFEYLDLDTNAFLFNGDSRQSLRRLLGRGFRIVCTCWNLDAVLLVHGAKKIAVWLHLAYCMSGPAMPRCMESIVKRNMLVQLSTMAVAWCQGESARGTMNDSFHDGNLSGYAYEHAKTAVHMYPIHGAACQRDVLTPIDTFALIQSDMSRAYERGITCPVASNLRKCASKARANKKKGQFKVNHLAIRRANNTMLLVKNRKKEAKPVVNKVGAIFQEDGANYKAILNRWKILRKAFRPDSKLLVAIKKHGPKKQNLGNTSRKRKNKEIQAMFTAELNQAKTLENLDKFWVRSGANNLRGARNMLPKPG